LVAQSLPLSHRHSILSSGGKFRFDLGNLFVAHIEVDVVSFPLAASSLRFWLIVLDMLILKDILRYLLGLLLGDPLVLDGGCLSKWILTHLKAQLVGNYSILLPVFIYSLV
jgi:hypothetical protein